jgi:hypothetical protein
MTAGKKMAAAADATQGMIRRSRPRTVAIVVASAAVLGASALMAGPANAAQVGSATVPAKLAAGSSRTGVPNFDAADCFTHMGDPSLNVNGDVIVTAAVSCTKPMRLLEATLDLEWNGITVEQDIRSGTTAVGVGVSSPCMPGAYVGHLTLDLVWPVGVNGPPTDSESTRTFVTTC